MLNSTSVSNQGKPREINVGWNDNASKKDVHSNTNWFLVPKNLLKQAGKDDIGEAVRSRPIIYGVTISLRYQGRQPFQNDVWRIQPIWNFVKYTKQKVNIHLKRDRDPSYEWAVLGDKLGISCA